MLAVWAGAVGTFDSLVNWVPAVCAARLSVGAAAPVTNLPIDLAPDAAGKILRAFKTIKIYNLFIFNFY